MEMLIPIGVAFAVSLRARHPAKPFLLFATFISLVSVFLSGSRGGVIALAVELTILWIAIAWSGHEVQGRKRLLVGGLLLATVAGAFFFWLDPGDTWKRWESMANAPRLDLGDRVTLTLDTMHMSRDHLVYGIGVGALEVAYPRYQTLVTDLVVDYAHNDYAQFFAESGLIGWILGPVSIAMFVILSFCRMRDRLLNGRTGLLQLGAAVGVCGIMIHSFSDFNLHIPANAAWFTVLVALAAIPQTVFHGPFSRATQNGPSTP
jgi:O-antigen ligase